MGIQAGSGGGKGQKGLSGRALAKESARQRAATMVSESDSDDDARGKKILASSDSDMDFRKKTKISNAVKLGSKISSSSSASPKKGLSAERIVASESSSSDDDDVDAKKKKTRGEVNEREARKREETARRERQEGEAEREVEPVQGGGFERLGLGNRRYQSGVTNRKRHSRRQGEERQIFLFEKERK